MSEIVNIVCLKWGDKYPVSYVNRLYNMVARNLTKSFRFYCLTENTEGLNPKIEHLPLNTSNLTGWWYKLILFQDNFFGLEGDLVYLDLDVVITSNIDFLVDQPGNFIIIRNWSKNMMWNSSVMRFRIGQYSHIWERFESEQERIVSELNGDQEWIFRCEPEVDYWPSDKVVSYKKSMKSKAFPLLEKFGLARLGLKAPSWMDTPLPAEVAIVVFHGKPDPEDVLLRSYGLWKRASFIKKHWK